MQDTFLCLPECQCDPALSRYFVLPIPYEGTVCFLSGTARGPEAILAVSDQMEHFDEEMLVDLAVGGIVTLPPVPAAETPKEQMQRIRLAVLQHDLFRSDRFPLFLGGEHSITPPIVRVATECYSNLCVLQLDAHADLRDAYTGGSYSHASAMRRVLESTDHLVQVGVRSFSEEEYEQCPERIGQIIRPNDIQRDYACCLDRILCSLTENVYITIDIDVFDPAFAPGTGTPEPGGLSWYEVTGILRAVSAQKNVVGADIVEVAPLGGSNVVTEFMAARLAGKLIAYDTAKRECKEKSPLLTLSSQHRQAIPLRRGMVLYIVAIIVAMLALGALALHNLLTIEYEATLYRGDEIQAGQLVQSGVEYVARMIEQSAIRSAPTDEFRDAMSAESTESATSNDPLYYNPDRFRGVEVVSIMLARPARGTGRFTVFSPRIEQDRLRGVRYGLINESARLHLGTVLQWETEMPGQGTRVLMKLPGMTPVIADSILDWIDSDKTPRSSGAERDFYENTGLPYRPRNEIPVSLEELLLVRDMTRELLFGTDQSFSYGAKMSDFQRSLVEAEIQDEMLLPPSELTPETQFPQPAATESVPAITEYSVGPELTETSLPWCFLLTTLSAEKQVDPEGNAKMDLNDSNLEFLEAQLLAFLDEECARFIVAWRKNNGKLDDPIDLLDATIPAEGEIAERKSPFSLEDGIAEERFLKLLDYATTISSVVVSGRINVNEAPRVVLAAVPDLTDSQVAQIVSRRGVQGTKRQGKYRHAIWLLSDKIVDKATMKKLSGCLTTGGDVYRAQVVGFYDLTGTTSRAEIVVDATVKPPRQIFSKDLTMFGSGFSR